MTDSISRQHLPVPLAYRHADRASVVAQLVHDLVAESPPGQRLTTKALSDPTVALLNGWATIADIVDFYQERIATENYLTTASEPESVLALAALLGYRPRPGLAATCWLAYTLVADPTDTAVMLPKHQLVQSVPGTGELPQFFETGEDLVARPSWNALTVKTTQALRMDASTGGYPDLVLAGAATQLRPNDVVLIALTAKPQQRIAVRVAQIGADVVANTTTVSLQEDSPTTAHEELTAPQGSLVDAAKRLLGPLVLPPSTPPVGDAAVVRDPATIFPVTHGGSPDLSDARIKVLAALHPGLSSALYPALATSTIGVPEVSSAQALRITTAPYGVQIPPRPRFDRHGQPQCPEEWPIGDTQTFRIVMDYYGDPRSVTFDGARIHLESPLGTGNSTIGDGIAKPQGNAGVNISVDPDGGPATTINFTPETTTGEAPLEKIVVAIDGADSPTIAVTNDNSQATVSAALAGAVLAADPTANMPAPSAASAIPGLFLRVELVLTPRRATAPESGDPLRLSKSMLAQQASVASSLVSGQLIIDIVSALPVAKRNILDLNERCDEIIPGSIVMVDDGSAVTNPVPVNPGGDQPTYPLLATVVSTATPAVSRYGMSPTVTRLVLDANWIGSNARLLSDLRTLTVHAQSVDLDLLPVPRPDPVSDSAIDVDGLYPGIGIGHRLVLTGTRDDLGDSSVQGAEAIMVAGVAQNSESGRPPYTTLTLAAPLSYRYRANTVTLYGNVVPAHQGVTITETPTATGDSKHPTFTLAQSPVLADPSGTPSGFASSLTVVVDGRTWTAVSRLDDTTPPRCYLTGTDGQGRITVTLGQPLPHPASAVTATYRCGAGGSGNVRAGQLTQPLTRPLAVATVTNPMPASGGSDPDGPDAVRSHAPRGLQALGRVVSVQDAADLALSWPGIGKASARFATHDHREVVRVTVSGVAPNPLDPASTLIGDLRAALTAAGDVVVPVEVEPAAVWLIVLVAQIDHDPDISWDTVERAVRTELTATYGYDQRGIDEDIIISDLVAVIHRIDGVRSCSITQVGQVNSDITVDALATFTPGAPADVLVTVTGVAYISDAVAETLILQEA